jgi:type I restriction enzyme M protein
MSSREAISSQREPTWYHPPRHPVHEYFSRLRPAVSWPAADPHPMPTTRTRIVGDTEPWFKQRVVEMMNNIIRDRGLSFERADAEQSVAVGRRTHLYFDAVLWKSRDIAVCEMELKRPFVDVADFELVNNAATKANAIGAPYFLTWNVRDLALWRTFEEGKPLLERRCRWWPGIVDVADVNELRDEHWQRISGFLVELLTELDGLFNRGKQFDGIAIDDFFVRKLSSVVASNYRIYSALIRERCEQDRTYFGELKRWTAEHGWSTLLSPTVANTDPLAFDVLGRLAVFLLMNRVIFYNLVRTQHRSLPAMSFRGLQSGRDFEQRLRKYFDAVLDIDFATVFGTDVFDELRVPTESVPQLERFVSDLNAYDFGTLSYEILGRVYETLIPERERHQLGQYFTPPTTVDLINAFCIRQADDVVLDPACGAGTFLVRAHARLNELRPRTHRALLEQLWGFEIAKFPAHIATINLVLPDLGEKENFPYVIPQNAFRVKPERTEVQVPKHKNLRYPTRNLQGTSDVLVKVPSFDAVVGNPPYIERRNLTTGDRRTITTALREDWAIARFTQAADIFVYFFVHAGRFLKEGGRLGFVTSNGWLDHRYGADLQTFFLDNFKIVAVIESRVERSFSQADINTAITIIERCSDKDQRENNIIRFVSLLRPLHEVLGADPLAGAPVLVDSILGITQQTVTERFRVYPVTQAEARAQGLDEDGEWIGGRWGAVYLRAPDIYFRLLERGAQFLVPLRRLADGVLGTKTGCDAFFVRSATDLASLGLEDRYSRPAYWSPGDSDAFVLDPRAASDRLVVISQSKHYLRGTNAGTYIEWGERHNFHRRGECARRARSLGRWYDLSQQVQSGRIAFGKTYNERHAVLWNPQECVLGARFASFSPAANIDEEVLLALLNSSMTAMFIEVMGRTSLGQGALDFAVYEAGALPVIDPNRLSGEIKDNLRAAYRRLITRRPLPMDEEVVSAEKTALDAIVFDALNLEQVERDAVIEALLAMNRGRRARANSIERVGRVGSAAPSDDEVLDFAMTETIAAVGLRRFPGDFPSLGDTTGLSLPDGHGIHEAVRVEVMMTQGTLVWPDGSYLECPSVEGAEYAALLLSLGWRQDLQIPSDRETARRAYLELSRYVSDCEAHFEVYLVIAGDGEAQAKRLRQRFRERLGQLMFSDVGVSQP